MHVFQPWRVRARSSHSSAHGPLGTYAWASGRSQASENSAHNAAIEWSIASIKFSKRITAIKENYLKLGNKEKR